MFKSKLLKEHDEIIDSIIQDIITLQKEAAAFNTWSAATTNLLQIISTRLVALEAKIEGKSKKQKT